MMSDAVEDEPDNSKVVFKNYDAGRYEPPLWFFKSYSTIGRASQEESFCVQEIVYFASAIPKSFYSNFSYAKNEFFVQQHYYFQLLKQKIRGAISMSKNAKTHIFEKS